MPATASNAENHRTMPPARVLVVTANGGAAPLAEALSRESSGELSLVEVLGSASAMHQLSEEAFAGIFVQHEPTKLDAVAFCEAARAAGHDQALVVLGNASAAELDAACASAGAEAYVCLSHATAASLWAITQRAINQASIARECRRLADAERRRLANDHDEAELLLAEQRRLVGQLETLTSPFADLGSLSSVDPSADEPFAKPDEATEAQTLVATEELYRELLQTYVIMGAGNLASEITALADRLVAEGFSGQAAIGLHVRVLEKVVVSLGTRSARHVMNRADLLLVELMVHLADGYRGRYDANHSEASTPSTDDLRDGQPQQFLSHRAA